MNLQAINLKPAHFDWRSIRINWDEMSDSLTELKAGLPLDENGNVANNGNAYGILMDDLIRGRNAYGRVVISGCIDLKEAEENCGMALSAAAKEALKQIWSPGGGSGGVSSWNDLTDKPFGEETGVVEVPVTGEWGLDEDGSHYGFSITAAIGLEVDKTYIVNWNGTDYEVVGQDMSALTGGEFLGVLLGNLSATGGGDTGEPFSILEFSDGVGVAMGLNGAKVPFSITTEGTVITPIEGKYLPKGTPWIEEGEMVEVLPEYTITEENVDADMASIPALGLVAGNTYVVKLNGTEYTCVAWNLTHPEMGAVVGLGDLYTATGGEFGTASTGEPFVLMEVSPEVAAQVGMNVIVQPLVETAFPIVFSIIDEGETIHKIDERCLPDGLPSIKKFDDIILEEVTTADVSNTFTDSIGEIVPGNIYNVIVDGEIYRCLATDGDSVEGIRINNCLEIYYDDKGMLAATPFKITVNTPTGAQFNNYTVKINIINREKFGVSHTFSIKGGTTRNFLSPECVPNDYPSVVYVDFVTEDGETYTTNATGAFISAMVKMGKRVVGRKMDVGGDVQFFKLEGTNYGAGWKFERVFTSLKGIRFVLRYEHFVFSDSSDSIGHYFGEAAAMTTMILSPNGSRYLLTVSDDGTLGTEQY